MGENIKITLRNSSGTAMTDKFGKTSVTTDWHGFGYLVFDNLPAGKYTIEQSNSYYYKKHSGSGMPFTLHTYGKNNSVGIV